MGYASYYRDGRWRGYGIPDVCNDPDCGKAGIDRGLSYLCHNCGGYFCGEHLTTAYCDEHDEPIFFDGQTFESGTQVCVRCDEKEEEEMKKEDYECSHNS
jgi:hypothetical protein